MQPVISQMALTFVDDAHALTIGLCKISHDLIVDLFTAARNRITRPVENLARACDVADIISARKATMSRLTAGRGRQKNIWAPPRKRRRLDIFGIRAAFRALHDLT